MNEEIIPLEIFVFHNEKVGNFLFLVALVGRN
jgi:hypothetical protein